MNPGQIILINKPYRWTSFDVVKKIKGALKRQATREQVQDSKEKNRIKLGHAGTLDPLATGLLVLCSGAMTKKIMEIQTAEKEYTGTFFLGATTASYDLETTVIVTDPVIPISNEKILEAVKKFSGKQWQIPPVHSAVKVDGKRAYSLARKGLDVELKAKEIEIKEFLITDIQFPQVRFKVICSKGTYIRSLAHDLGHSLGCGAYLASLCRTRIGEYRLEHALEVEDFVSQISDYQ